MPYSKMLYTQTALAKGLSKLFQQLEERLSLDRPLPVYLAGGMAVHLYTGERVTNDVDAEFGMKVLIPNGLAVDVEMEDGSAHVIYLDTNYNPGFALMHEDYQEDAIPVDLDLKQFRVHVLSPVDLAVSKIARLADNDRRDIQKLVSIGVTTSDDIELRARSAVTGYIGGQAKPCSFHF